MRTVNFENGSPPSSPPSKQVIQGKQTRDREYDCACEGGRIDGGHWQNLHSRPNWQLSARWNWNWVVEVVGTLFFFLRAKPRCKYWDNLHERVIPLSASYIQGFNSLLSSQLFSKNRGRKGRKAPRGRGSVGKERKRQMQNRARSKFSPLICKP